MEVNVPLYSAEQIRVPPDLPDILKSYTKHILRQQPKDILAASAEYFTQLSNATAQKRFRSSGMEADVLRRLWKTLETRWPDAAALPRDDVAGVCADLGIQAWGINDLLRLGGWKESVPKRKFWALAVGSTNENLAGTMRSVIDLTSDGVGNAPSGPLAEMFRFLAERDPDLPPTKIEAICQALLAQPDVSRDAATAVFRSHHLGGDW